MSDTLDEARLRAIAQQLRRSTRFQEIVRSEVTPQQALDVVAMAHGYPSWSQLQASLRADPGGQVPAATATDVPAPSMPPPASPSTNGEGTVTTLDRVRGLIRHPLEVWVGRARAQGRVVWLGFAGRHLELEVMVSGLAAGTVAPELLALVNDQDAPHQALQQLCDALRGLVNEGVIGPVPQAIEPLP